MPILLTHDPAAGNGRGSSSRRSRRLSRSSSRGAGSRTSSGRDRPERRYVLRDGAVGERVVAISAGVLWLGSGWDNPLRLAFIGLGVALLVGYLAWERGAGSPTRPTLRVDRRPVTVALFAGVVIALAQSVPMVLLPQYFAIVDRFGPVFGMLAVAPLFLGLVVAGPDRRLPAVAVHAPGAGRGRAAGGGARQPRRRAARGPGTGYVLFVLPLLLIGAGFVVGTTVRTAIIFASVPRGLPATAAALNEASIAVGNRIGIVLVTAIVAGVALATYDALARRGAPGRGPARRVRGPPVRRRDAVVPGARGRRPPGGRGRLPRRLRGRRAHRARAGGRRRAARRAGRLARCSASATRWRPAAPTRWARCTSTATSARAGVLSRGDPVPRAILHR